MVELNVNGKQIDLAEKGNEIKYTKQIADVFDIASVSSSFTNSFEVPKTPSNTIAFEGLGIAGDTSTIPYVKTSATIKNQGFDLVREGILNVTETNDNYKVSVIDGIIELFKSMENKTIGVDLDLSDFNHEKNIQTVVDSISNDFYKYIVADYGGKIMTQEGGINGINIDYLVPSFSVQKILQLIFDTFGFQVDFGGLSEFLEGLFITYPKPPEVLVEDYVQSADLLKPNYISPYIFQDNVWRIPVPNSYWYSSSVIDEGAVYGNRYSFPVSGVYKLNLKIKGYALYTGVNLGISSYAPYTVSIEIDNVPILQFQTNPLEILENEVSVFVQGGSEVTIKSFVTVFQYGGNSISAIRLKEFRVNVTELDIKRISQGNVSLSNAFKSFKITDFIKEIIWRTGTTPLISQDKVVSFISIEDRLKRENASMALNDKFVERKSEKYIKGSYSQRNAFKMKYNVEGNNINDGILTVNNQNLDAERTLAQSQIYAPENYTSVFTDISESNPVNASVFTMWNKTPKEESDGTLTVEYKALDNRYYFIRYVEQEGEWRYSSDAIEGSSQNVPVILVANTSQTLFSELIPLRYAQYQKIFNSFRVHDIELALGLKDILSIDLTKIYYFEREAKYYMINRINFQEGQTSTAECVAVVPSLNGVFLESVTREGDVFTATFFTVGLASQQAKLQFKNHNQNIWITYPYSESPKVITFAYNPNITYQFRAFSEGYYSNIIEI